MTDDYQNLGGAFAEEVKRVVDLDLKLKSKIIQEYLDNTESHPEMATMTGQDMAAFIFGDMQEFADKFKGL